jgi:hypothetical protein
LVRPSILIYDGNKRESSIDSTVCALSKVEVAVSRGNSLSESLITFISVLQGQSPLLYNILLKPLPLLRGQFDISLQLILFFDGILELAKIA